MRSRTVACTSLVIAALASTGFGCPGSGSALGPPPPGRHILFVGNSLTFVNDLPATLAAIAAAAGDTVHVRTVAGPNLALIDHLNGATDAVQVIQQGGWDYVVLQQGPTSTGGVCQDSLVLWTRMFETPIRGAGAVPALFMVWPSSDRLAYLDNVRSAYAQAAAAVHGVFLPAGEAWRLAWAADSTLALYGPDGFHPSPMGTFLAALTIYERLRGRDARTLPPLAFANGVAVPMPEGTVRMLQAAAHAANVQYPSAVSGAYTQNGAPQAPRSSRC